MLGVVACLPEADLVVDYITYTYHVYDFVDSTVLSTHLLRARSGGEWRWQHTHGNRRPPCLHKSRNKG